jgi:pSer/pThr/pTyr-binding forkhead associated (FHA) protein
MALEAHGQLIPVGGGDPIPLSRDLLTFGRRESCDVCLKFQNISGLHCELSYREGYWFVRDLGSTNGIKVNGTRVLSRPLKPGDELAIAQRRYTIQYNLPASAQSALEEVLSEDEDLSVPLMQKAGLARQRNRDRDDD